MNNPRFCDLHACGVNIAKEVETGLPVEKDIAAYRDEFLTPYTVGARKTIALFGNPDLTIGAFVTNILISHLAANRTVINELTGRGSKTVLV